jgi:hypothetical protein
MDKSEAGAAPSAATSPQQNRSRDIEAFLGLTSIQDNRLIKSDAMRAVLAALLGLMLFAAIRWGVLLSD